MTDPETRLRQAFQALADSVDTEPLVTQRRRRPLVPVLATAATVLVIGAAVVLARQSPEPAPPAAVSTAPTLTARAVPFDLLTHCGVDEALVEGVYYEAETPLIGPARSAPDGWDNPYQRGTMTLISSATAVFHDDLGHEVRFRARAGATTFKHLCD